MTAVHPDLKYFLEVKLHFYWYCTSSAIPTTSLGMSRGVSVRLIKRLVEDSGLYLKNWWEAGGVKASSLYLAAEVTKPMSPKKIASRITDTFSKQETFLKLTLRLQQ